MQAIKDMSETLESSGMPSAQSQAVIESLALAMEGFSVTSEILEAQLAKERKETNRRFDETDRRFDETDRRLDEIPELRKEIAKLSEATHEFQRTMMRYFIVFALAMFGALITLFGGLFGALLTIFGTA